MLEFQIEYPRGSGFACGRTEEPGCATVRDVRFSSRADVIGVGIYVSQVPLGRPWRKCMLLLKG